MARPDPAQIARGLDLLRQGWTWRAAAAEVGITEPTLRAHAKAEGAVPDRRPGSRPALDPGQVQQMHRSGMTVVDIAAALGTSKTAVVSALDYAGVTRTTRRVRSARPITPAETKELERAARQSDPAVLAGVALRLHAEGVPIAVQSIAAGRSRGWLYYRLRSNGYHLTEHDAVRRRQPRPEHDPDHRWPGP